MIKCLFFGLVAFSVGTQAIILRGKITCGGIPLSGAKIEMRQPGEK